MNLELKIVTYNALFRSKAVTETADNRPNIFCECISHYDSTNNIISIIIDKDVPNN